MKGFYGCRITCRCTECGCGSQIVDTQIVVLKIQMLEIQITECGCTECEYTECEHTECEVFLRVMISVDLADLRLLQFPSNRSRSIPMRTHNLCRECVMKGSPIRLVLREMGVEQ